MFKKGFSTILIVVIVLVVVAGGVLAWQYWPEKNLTEESCTTEGGIECNVMGCKPCCEPLEDRVVLTAVNIAGEVTCVEEMTQQVCVNCGDGICGIGENWCICPEDCKKLNTNNLEMIDSRIYRNPQLGFSIEYPSSWEKSEELLGTATRINFLAPNKKAITWVRVGSYYNQTKGRNSTLDELLSNIKLSYDVLKDDELIINNISVRRFYLLWSEEVFGYVSFIQRKESGIIEIGTEIRDVDKQDEYYSIFNQMLSTFKLID